jgi:polysaccharide transporter, PST family
MVGFFWLYRAVPYQHPTSKMIINSLKNGSILFLSNIIGSFYTAINSFILGLLSTASAVSFYGASERISKTALTVTQPVTQVLFPRMSHLLAAEPVKAAKVIRLSLFFMTLVSLVLTLILIIFAPIIVKTLLGEGFEPAIPVLRVLSLLIPLISWGQVLGLQWLIPLGFDNVYVVLGLIAGVINITLAVLLASRYGAVGMAWSVVVAELVVVIGIVIALQVRGNNPLLKLQWEKDKL